MSKWPVDPAIAAAILTIFGGIAGYLVRNVIDELRKYITAVDDHVGRLESRQVTCCDELPRRYADKADTYKRLDDHGRRLDGHGVRLDDHGERIVRVEGKVGL
jgi:hypothetical protein